MNINGLLIIWIIPSIIYYIVKKKKGIEKKLLLSDLGLKLGSIKYAVLGLLLGTIGVIITVYLANIDVFPNLINKYNLNNQTVDLPKNIKTFLLIFVIVGLSTATGEEVFFRGFLGNILIRKWNFIIGNNIQALVFASFHVIPIIFIDSNLVIFSFMYSFTSGLVLGLLSYKSSSIIPSILAHSIGFPVLFLIL